MGWNFLSQLKQGSLAAQGRNGLIWQSYNFQINGVFIQVGKGQSIASSCLSRTNSVAALGSNSFAESQSTEIDAATPKRFIGGDLSVERRESLQGIS